MELAVNTFSKGLQTDTHPMVQGTDTLSDALNATFITMNGNEVVLQNDMGNRRVDNAYLPAGYEPVGIKEYGGIIYLALYNPITNRSLIGSFPSPERDISGTDSNNDDINFNLRELFNNYDTVERTYNGSKYIIKYLKNDTLLIPISSSTALHPGDKFTLYLDGISQAYLGDRLFKLMISNWNLYSFRDLKRKYTLSLGILNSQNEFVDITPSLERFNDDGDLIKTEFKSELDKFNTGYFICPKAKPLSSESTLDRDSIASNVYSYKLVGPLYLKAEVSHVKNFGYSVRLSKTQNELGQTTEVTLEIRGTSTYDFFIRLYERNSSESMGGLSPLDGQTDGNIWISNNLFTPILEDLYKTGNVSTHKDISIDEVSRTITLTSQITFVPNQGDEVSIYLEVLGPSSYDFNSLYYLKNLSKVFTFNISDIGTDKMEVTEWRYYLSNINRDDSSFDCLCYLALRCYTEEGFVYKNLSVKVGNREVYSKQSDIFSGGFPFSFRRDSENLGEILEVTIECGKYTKENPDTPSSTVTFTRFLLTTELFNECYNNPDSKDFIIFLNGYEEKLSESLKILRDRMLTIVPTVDTSEIVVNDSSMSSLEIFSKQPYSKKVIYNTIRTITLDPTKLKLDFDSDKYPAGITLSITNPDFREFEYDDDEILMMELGRYTMFRASDKCKSDSITEHRNMNVFALSDSEQFRLFYVCPDNVGWVGEHYSDGAVHRHFHILGPGNYHKWMGYYWGNGSLHDLEWNIKVDLDDYDGFAWGDYIGGKFLLAYNDLIILCKNSGYSFFKLYSFPEYREHPTSHFITKNYTSDLGASPSVNTYPYELSDAYSLWPNHVCYEFMFNSNRDNFVIVGIVTPEYSGKGGGNYLFPLYNFDIYESLYYPKKESLSYTEARALDINFKLNGNINLNLTLDTSLLDFKCQESFNILALYQMLMSGVSEDFIKQIKTGAIFNNGVVDLSNAKIIPNKTWGDVKTSVLYPSTHQLAYESANNSLGVTVSVPDGMLRAVVRSTSNESTEGDRFVHMVFNSLGYKQYSNTSLYFGLLQYRPLLHTL